MSYRITVIADYNGTLYFGADKRALAHEVASPICEAKLYSSQIPFAISARTPDGRIVVTTRTKARTSGWTPLRDCQNRRIEEDPKRNQAPQERLKEHLERLAYHPLSTLPWGEDDSLPAGIVIRVRNRYIIIGHDMQGSTSAHFIGGEPWKDCLRDAREGVSWAWIFNE